MFFFSLSHRYIGRCICLVTALSFILTSSLLAPNSLRASTSSVTSTISIPGALGLIDESKTGLSDKTVIYIQDAHDSLEAQLNIASMIDYLVKEGGVKTVFEEGYEGPVPTDEFFGFIKDKDIKQATSYYFLDKLRIGGAEYAHINRTQDFNLIGADSLNLHLQNIAWSQESSKYQKETEKDVKEIAKHLKQLQNRYFPKEIKTWIKLRNRFDNEQLSLLDYLKRTAALQTMSDEAKASEYPSITLLLKAEGTEDEVLLEQVGDIDSKTLFSEIDKLETDLANQYLSTDRDKNIFSYSKSVSLIERLNKLEVTPDEYEVVKEKLTTLNTQDLADFIAKNTKKDLILSNKWEENLNRSINFYTVAKARDKAIESSLQNFIDNPDEKVAVLVYGGFHKGGIKEILHNLKLNYEIVSPNITKQSKRHKDYYKVLMSKGYLDSEAPENLSNASRPMSLFQQAKVLGVSGIAAVRSAVAKVADVVRNLLTSTGTATPKQIDRKIPKAGLFGARNILSLAVLTMLSYIGLSGKVISFNEPSKSPRRAALASAEEAVDLSGRQLVDAAKPTEIPGGDLLSVLPTVENQEPEIRMLSPMQNPSTFEVFPFPLRGGFLTYRKNPNRVDNWVGIEVLFDDYSTPDPEFVDLSQLQNLNLIIVSTANNLIFEIADADGRTVKLPMQTVLRSEGFDWLRQIDIRSAQGQIDLSRITRFNVNIDNPQTEGWLGLLTAFSNSRTIVPSADDITVSKLSAIPVHRNIRPMIPEGNLSTVAALKYDLYEVMALNYQTDLRAYAGGSMTFGDGVSWRHLDFADFLIFSQEPVTAVVVDSEGRKAVYQIPSTEQNILRFGFPLDDLKKHVDVDRIQLINFFVHGKNKEGALYVAYLPDSHSENGRVGDMEFEEGDIALTDIIYESMIENAKKTASQPYKPFIPEENPLYDTSPSAARDDVGLVFDEHNAIQVVNNIFDNGRAFIQQRPAGVFDNLPMNIFRVVGGEVVYYEFNDLDFDVSDPIIQPILPVTWSEEEERYYHKWEENRRYYCRLNLGTRLAYDYPVYHTINSTGYVRSLAKDLMQEVGFGLSFRFLLHKLGTDQESYPHLHTATVLTADWEGQQGYRVIMQFSNEAYEAVVEADFSFGLPSTIRINRATLVARQDMAPGELGIGGWSSYYWNESGHDSDTLIVKGDQGSVIRYSLNNPTEPTSTFFRDQMLSGEQIESVYLEQQNRSPEKYIQIPTAPYDRRANGGIEDIKASFETDVMLYGFPTNSEYFDNIAVSVVNRDPIQSGEVVTYEFKNLTYSKSVEIDLTEEGYQAVLEQDDFSKLKEYIRAVINNLGYRIVNEGDLHGFSEWYTAGHSQTLDNMMREINSGGFNWIVPYVITSSNVFKVPVTEDGYKAVYATNSFELMKEYIRHVISSEYGYEVVGEAGLANFTTFFAEPYENYLRVMLAKLNRNIANGSYDWLVPGNYNVRSVAKLSDEANLPSLSSGVRHIMNRVPVRFLGAGPLPYKNGNDVTSPMPDPNLKIPEKNLTEESNVDGSDQNANSLGVWELFQEKMVSAPRVEVGQEPERRLGFLSRVLLTGFLGLISRFGSAGEVAAPVQKTSDAFLPAATTPEAGEVPAEVTEVEDYSHLRQEVNGNITYGYASYTEKQNAQEFPFESLEAVMMKDVYNAKKMVTVFMEIFHSPKAGKANQVSITHDGIAYNFLLTNDNEVIIYNRGGIYASIEGLPTDYGQGQEAGGVGRVRYLAPKLTVKDSKLFYSYYDADLKFHFEEFEVDYLDALPEFIAESDDGVFKLHKIAGQLFFYNTQDGNIRWHRTTQSEMKTHPEIRYAEFVSENNAVLLGAYEGIFRKIISPEDTGFDSAKGKADSSAEEYSAFLANQLYLNRAPSDKVEYGLFNIRIDGQPSYGIDMGLAEFYFVAGDSGVIRTNQNNKTYVLDSDYKRVFQVDRSEVGTNYFNIYDLKPTGDLIPFGSLDPIELLEEGELMTRMKIFPDVPGGAYVIGVSPERTSVMIGVDRRRGDHTPPSKFALLTPTGFYKFNVPHSIYSVTYIENNRVLIELANRDEMILDTSIPQIEGLEIPPVKLDIEVVFTNYTDLGRLLLELEGYSFFPEEDSLDRWLLPGGDKNETFEGIYSASVKGDKLILGVRGTYEESGQKVPFSQYVAYQGKGYDDEGKRVIPEKLVSAVTTPKMIKSVSFDEDDNYVITYMDGMTVIEYHDDFMRWKETGGFEIPEDTDTYTPTDQETKDKIAEIDEELAELTEPETEEIKPGPGDPIEAIPADELEVTTGDGKTGTIGELGDGFSLEDIFGKPDDEGETPGEGDVPDIIEIPGEDDPDVGETPGTGEESGIGETPDEIPGSEGEQFVGDAPVLDVEPGIEITPEIADLFDLLKDILATRRGTGSISRTGDSDIRQPRIERVGYEAPDMRGVIPYGSPRVDRPQAPQEDVVEEVSAEEKGIPGDGVPSGPSADDIALQIARDQGYVGAQGPMAGVTPLDIVPEDQIIQLPEAISQIKEAAPVPAIEDFSEEGPASEIEGEVESAVVEDILSRLSGEAPKQTLIDAAVKKQIQELLLDTMTIDNEEVPITDVELIRVEGTKAFFNQLVEHSIEVADTSMKITVGREVVVDLETGESEPKEMVVIHMAILDKALLDSLKVKRGLEAKIPLHIYMDYGDYKKLSPEQREEHKFLMSRNPELKVIIFNAPKKTSGAERVEYSRKGKLVITSKPVRKIAKFIENSIFMSKETDIPEDLEHVVGPNKFRYQEQRRGLLGSAILYAVAEDKKLFEIRYGLMRDGDGYVVEVGEYLEKLVLSYEASLSLGQAA